MRLALGYLAELVVNVGDSALHVGREDDGLHVEGELQRQQSFFSGRISAFSASLALPDPNITLRDIRRAEELTATEYQYNTTYPLEPGRADRG